MALFLKPLNPDLYPPGSFTIPEESGVFRVGREKGNHLKVNHSSVSAQHAKIVVDAESGIDVVDCGSSNGTFVNGIKVEKSRLTAGDLLRFATAEFRVAQRETEDSEIEGYRPNGYPRHTAPLANGPVAAANGVGNSPESDAPELALRAEIADLSAENARLLELAAAWESHAAVREAELASLSARFQEQGVSMRGLLAAKESEISTLRARVNEQGESLEVRQEEISTWKTRLRAEEEVLKSLRASHAEELAGLSAELKEAKKQREALVSAHDREASSLTGTLKEKEETIRRLTRQVDDYAARDERNQNQLSETRRTLMDREGTIVGLQYEVSTRDGNLRQLGEEHSLLQDTHEKLLAEHSELQERFEAKENELAEALAAREEAETLANSIIERLHRLSERLLADWCFWFTAEDEGGLDPGVDLAFARVEEIAGRIREELDGIEPIWGQFGAGVQARLSQRCDILRTETEEVSEELEKRRQDLAETTGNLEQIRELVDLEVRRAQGLSRRGTEIEIPERFESMVIARDREQEIFRALIERLELLDEIIKGCPRSRKFRSLVTHLEEFRVRFAAVLEVSGVSDFEIPVGTFLTLKHRKEVQILSRKGWGTSQYSEFPFQPGEVVKLVRPGYRAGKGEGGVILRKAEVLIRGMDE